MGAVSGLCFAAVFLAGCYQTADEMTSDEFAHAYAAEYCRRISECCDEEDLTTMFPPGSAERVPDDCAWRMGGRVLGDFSFVLSFMRVRYDPDAARECIAAMQHGVCGDLTEVSRVCLDVLEPLAGPGERCGTPRDCTTGGCLYPEGVCGDPLPVGSPCNPDETTCGSGLKCSLDLEICVYDGPTCDGV